MKEKNDIELEVIITPVNLFKKISNELLEGNYSRITIWDSLTQLLKLNKKTKVARQIQENLQQLVHEKLQVENNIHAKVCLGVLHCLGNGVEQDLKKAIALFKEGIEMGNSNAMNNLAYLYRRGLGIEQNIEKGTELYNKAAELDNDAAMNNLAYICENSTGTTRKLTKAIELYEKAIERGNVASMNQLADMYRAGKFIKKNLKQAIELYKQADALGCARASNMLANMYEAGEGFTEDLKEAIRLYKKAAELGNANAMHRLAMFYQHGECLRQDLNQAIKFFEQAVDLYNADAMNSLACLYNNGKGLKQDTPQAIKLFEMGWRLGNKSCKYNLAKIWEIHNMSKLGGAVLFFNIFKNNPFLPCLTLAACWDDLLQSLPFSSHTLNSFNEDETCRQQIQDMIYRIPKENMSFGNIYWVMKKLREPDHCIYQMLDENEGQSIKQFCRKFIENTKTLLLYRKFLTNEKKIRIEKQLFFGIILNSMERNSIPASPKGLGS